MFDIPVRYIHKDVDAVFTINNERVFKYSPNLVGYCTSKKHTGFLTTRDIHDHKCREKGCACLRMLTHKDHYWGKYFREQEELRQKKLEKKRDIRDREETQYRIRRHWELFVQKGNKWLEETGYGQQVELISAKRDKESGKLNIIYVSDSRLNKEDFSKIFSHLKESAGQFDIYLIRAKDTDGKYPTVEEWHNSSRFAEKQKETLKGMMS